MNQRLLSIDVLRGLTIAFMILVNTPGSWEFVYAPLQHAKWDGCTPTDLVFPFFLFIVGLSMGQSLPKIQNRSVLVRKLLYRTAIIFLIGLFLNYFPFFNKELSHLRIFGVLQRIALAYGLSGLIICFVKEKWHLLVTLGILFIYFFIMIANGQEGLTLEGNLVRKIDLALIGENHMYQGYGIPFDPEGLLSVLGSIGNVMFGYILAIKNKNQTIDTQINISAIFGFVLVAFGLVWNFVFPINKPIWSSSYAMFTSGLCAILYSLFLYIIDKKGISKWAFPFKVFGMNAIISYVLASVIHTLLRLVKISDQSLPAYVYDHFFMNIINPYFGSFLQAISYCILIWLIALILYKKSWFFKV